MFKVTPEMELADSGHESLLEYFVLNKARIPNTCKINMAKASIIFVIVLLSSVVWECRSCTDDWSKFKIVGHTGIQYTITIIIIVILMKISLKLNLRMHKKKLDSVKVGKKKHIEQKKILCYYSLLMVRGSFSMDMTIFEFYIGNIISAS